MRSSPLCIAVHIVCAVRTGNIILTEDDLADFYDHIGNHAARQKQSVKAASALPDHLHLLLLLDADASISGFVRSFKSASARWINQRPDLPSTFGWQRGFGAFSCSNADLNRVIAYISRQRQYHIERTFQEEYLDMLRRAEIKPGPGSLFSFGTASQADPGECTEAMPPADAEPSPADAGISAV